jgi:ABC-type amino acid transport substrate-binding protein
MLLTVFVPLRHSEILSALRDAFFIAIVTSLSVASLPLIQSAAESFARKHTSAPENERSEIVQTTLSVSYPLAQIGNFFILIFLFYATYYYSVHLEPSHLLAMPFVTLLSGIGSPTSSIGAVQFMSGWLDIPPEATGLYVETMAVTRYAQVVASVSAFAFITIFVTFAFYGKLRFNLRALGLTVSVAAVAMFAIWSLGRWGGSHIKLQSNISYMSVGLPEDVQRLSDANDARLIGNAPDDDGAATPGEGADVLPGNTLDRIQNRGVLRVGINPNIMPFTYINAENRLVGYDVELIYRFAQSMNVKLEFVPFAWQHLIANLQKEKFDIAISGIYITDDRLRTVTVSHPYFQSPLALMVRSNRVDEFESRESIDDIANLTIAVFNDPVLIPLAKRTFPSATLKILPDYNDLAAQEDVDAALWTQEQARAWAIANNGYSAVVPRNTAIRFLFGYLMPPDSDGLVDYLNYWLDLEQANGTMADMARRWIDPAVKSDVD